jgi:diguanylate cyclase (GGDEF)-like protein/PAS domain S-box-containing protein
MDAVLDAVSLSVLITPSLWFLAVLPLARSKEALLEKEAGILNASCDGIIIVSGNGDILQSNAAAQRMFGFDEEQEIHCKFHELLQDTSQNENYDSDALGEHLMEASAVGQYFQTGGLRRDMTTFPMDVSVGQIESSAERKFVIVIRDMSEQKFLESERDVAISGLSELVVNVKKAQEQAELASRRFQRLFDELPIPCYTFDKSGEIFEVNQEFCRFYGKEPEDVLYRSMWTSVISLDDELTSREAVAKLFAGEEIRNVEQIDIAADGSEKRVLVSMLPLAGLNGEIAGCMRASVDITKLKVLEDELRVQLDEVVQSRQDLQDANKKLEGLATTDVMTGLSNHRHFQEVLQATCERRTLIAKPTSLILLDVDNFKKFNDSFGHQAGDAVLAQVGLILSENVRPKDTAARYGGEEFVVILPETDAGTATTIAERLRLALETATWEHRNITASFGVTTSLTEGIDHKLLVEQADQALYASKRDGRNRVSHHNQLTTQVEKHVA